MGLQNIAFPDLIWRIPLPNTAPSCKYRLRDPRPHATRGFGRSLYLTVHERPLDHIVASFTDVR
jgi:hypothetical protein